MFRFPSFASHGHTLCLLLAGVAGSFAIDTNAHAQVVEPGQKFTLRSQDTPLMLGDRVLATIPAGTRLSAEAVRGDWVLTTVTVNGQPVRGWIRVARRAASPPPTRSANQSAPARNPVPTNPPAMSGGSGASDARIQQLEQRVRQLEQQLAAGGVGGSGGGGSAGSGNDRPSQDVAAALGRKYANSLQMWRHASHLQQTGAAGGSAQAEAASRRDVLAAEAEYAAATGALTHAVDTQKSAVVAAQDAIEAVQAAYQTGSASYADLLETVNQLSDTEVKLAQLQALVASGQSSTQFQRPAGIEAGPYPQDVKTPDPVGARYGNPGTSDNRYSQPPSDSLQPGNGLQPGSGLKPANP